jgi:hypothetical protein
MIAPFLQTARKAYAAAPSHAPVGEYPARGCVCVATALDLAWHTYPDAHDEGTRLLALVAGLPASDVRMELIRWNAEATTEEVLATFDHAIGEAATCV